MDVNSHARGLSFEARKCAQLRMTAVQVETTLPEKYWRDDRPFSMMNIIYTPRE